MKQKRQRLVNRCALQNETHIFMIDEYSISNYGMIKGYFRLKVITKANFDKFAKMSDEEKNAKVLFDLCDEAKTFRAFLFSLTNHIQSNYEGFEGVKVGHGMTQLVQNAFKGSEKSKWFEFKRFPKDK
tara:strand:+ start:1088 stop:1471 length:384 start_codon:yes stop_codon:yes gene_type:complete